MRRASTTVARLVVPLVASLAVAGCITPGVYRSWEEDLKTLVRRPARVEDVSHIMGFAPSCQPLDPERFGMALTLGLWVDQTNEGLPWFNRACLPSRLESLWVTLFSN